MIKQGHRPTVGEELWIKVPSYHRQPTEVHRATVVKVGPQWVYFTEVPGLHEAKFRVRTQHTENRSNYNAWYLTQEQFEHEQKMKEARETLKKHKVNVEWSVFLKDDEKFVKLADAVREIMEESSAES